MTDKQARLYSQTCDRTQRAARKFSVIRLIVKSELIPEQRLELLRGECDQLCKIIAKSLVTAKSNQSRPKKANDEEEKLQ
jgi:hypothetical protein